MKTVKITTVDTIAKKILTMAHVDESEIELLLDTFHYADKRGQNAHGVGRLPLYIRKIKAGKLNPKDESEIVIDNEAVSVIDGRNGFGQVVSKKAAVVAIERARRCGIATVGVRNSNNFGCAGYYGNLIAKSGLCGLIMANAAPAIAPYGGNKPIFGTNPICFFAPGYESSEPIVLDMATTVAARGKIRAALKNGEKIPEGWAIDKYGNITTDPVEALEGFLLPIGGYKGYGISLFVDLFAGLLTGSAYGGGVRPLSDTGDESRNGHFFVVIDPHRFIDKETYDLRIRKMCESIKECGDERTVLIPGERGNNRLKSFEDCIELSEKQIEEINVLANEMSIEERL